MKPKDPTPKESQCGLVYHIKCQSCEHTYIGETGRNMGVRFKEHTTRKNTNSAVKEHLEATNHRCSMENVKILEREENWYKRKIKEAIMIQRHQPTLNRDKGLELPPVYSSLLSHDPNGSCDSSAPQQRHWRRRRDGCRKFWQRYFNDLLKVNSSIYLFIVLVVKIIGCFNPKFQVRKTCQQAVSSILKGSIFLSQPKGPKIHPAAASTAKFCVSQIEKCGGKVQAWRSTVLRKFCTRHPKIDQYSSNFKLNSYCAKIAEFMPGSCNASHYVFYHFRQHFLFWCHHFLFW